MFGLLDRLDLESQPPRPRDSAGISALAIVERIEAGTPMTDLLHESHLTADDLLACVAMAGLGPGEDDGPALVQTRPARPELVNALNPTSLGRLFPDAKGPQVLALLAGLHQVLDAWESSHTAAQEADDQGERGTSAFWHGIAHRREPDAWNSGYWFRRVGAHAIFPALARVAAPLLAAHGDPALTRRLIVDGSWDPFAFIDICTTARASSPQAALARRLQRLEMSLLLEHSIQGLTNTSR